MERLAKAGLGKREPSLTDRALDESDPASPRVRFSLLTTPDIPEGRVHLIRHLTPDALWQPRFLDHPNGAQSLASVVIASAEPARTATRLSLRAGRPVRPDPLGGYVLRLTQGAIRILPEDAARSLLPNAVMPVLPCIAGLEITANISAAAFSDAAGVALRFIP